MAVGKPFIDEVKLKRAPHFSGCLVACLAKNASLDLITSALVIEMFCHYSGPRLVILIISVEC